MQDIVDGALRKLSVLSREEQASGPLGDQTVVSYNEMLHGWRKKSVDVNHSTQTITDTFQLDDMHVEGVKALLAVKIAPDHQESNSADMPAIRREANDGWHGLIADYWVIDEMQVDTALQYLPSQRRRGRI